MAAPKIATTRQGGGVAAGRFARRRIEGCRDIEQLRGWLLRAVTVARV